jgi:ABC-2 type transport system permease protein
VKNLKYALSDYMTMTGRCVRLMLRNVDVLITAVVLPVAMMAIFVFVFGGAIQTGEEKYVQFIVPGVVITSIGYCAAGTAVSVQTDIARGIVDRFRTLPIAGSSFLVSHVIASVLRNCISTLLVFMTGVLLGYRANLTPEGLWLLIPMLLAYAIAITCISVIFGLMAASPEGAGAFGFVILFLPYFSSGFVPTETMPYALRLFAENQPVTLVLETVRGALDGTTAACAADAFIWCAAFILICGAVSPVLLRKRRTA